MLEEPSAGIGPRPRLVPVFVSASREVVAFQLVRQLGRFKRTAFGGALLAGLAPDLRLGGGGGGGEVEGLDGAGERNAAQDR